MVISRSRYFSSLRIAFLIFACCSMLVSLSARAAEWSIEPSVSLHEEYNDNIRFIADPHPKVWETSLIPNVKFSNKTAISEVSGQAQLGINRYSGDTTLNQTDRLFLLFASRMSERNTWSMNTSYKRDTTSELDATGVVQPRTQRSVLTFGPSWTHSLTERLSLRFDYQYQDVKYDSATSTDYTYKQAASAMQYILSERDKLNIQALYSRVDYSPVMGLGCASYLITLCIEPEAIEILSKATTYGAQLDWNHLYSQTMTGSFSIGYHKVVNQQISNTTTTNILIPGAEYSSSDSLSRTNTYSFSANIEKQYETGAINGSISREVIPSGSGLVTTNRLGLSLNKSFNENLTGYLDSAVYRTTYISLGSPALRYYTFEPRLNWRLSEYWTLDGGYRYSHIVYDDNSPAITANAIYLNLNYSWPKMAISR